jgi:hypothetical protein
MEVKTKNLPLLSGVLFLLFCSSACRKHKLDNNSLPPATQEGKNTLGFLLNGKPWTPKGFNGNPNMSLYYDTTYRNGTFNIYCYYLPNKGSGYRQSFSIAADSVQNIGKIIFGEKDLSVVFRDNFDYSCDYESYDSTVIAYGYCSVTKMDKVNGIFSGTFNFTMIKSGCDTIKITAGRFDMKLQ